MTRVLLPMVMILAALTSAAHAEVKGGGRIIECFCTDSTGGRVELGESICLFVDGRLFTARCEMSLNNPMWREVNEGCLSSGLIKRLQQLQPLAYSRPVDTQI